MHACSMQALIHCTTICKIPTWGGFSHPRVRLVAAAHAA